MQRVTRRRTTGPLRAACLAALLISAASATYAQIAVIRAPGSPAMTKAQVAKIYLGRSFELRPFDLPQNTELRSVFYRHAADSEPAQVKAAWARVTFTGRGEPPLEMLNAEAVKKAVASDPLAIGYIDAASVDATVKVVLTLP